MKSSHLILLLTVSLFFSTSALAKKTGDSPFPPEWHACKSSKECVVVKGLCGAWECINRVGAPQLDKLNRGMEKKYGCRGMDKPKLKPSAICVKNKGCQCKKAKAKDGWNTW